MASWITILLSVILTALCSVTFMIISSSMKKKHKMDFSSDNSKLVLPPGPRGLPIIGNLHMLSVLPHQDLRRLAQKYGPIMHIRLGLVPTIVVSSPEAAKLFLNTHDAVFASRPIIQAGQYMGYGQKGLVLSPYGSYTRTVRKLCTQELFSNSKIELFRPMRREELSNLVKVLKVAADEHEVVCLSEKVEKLVEDMILRMVFGCKDDSLNIKSAINEALKLTGTFNIGDYVPFLAAFDLQGLVRRMKIVGKVYDELLEKIIEKHIQDVKEQHVQFRDFIDVMLSLMETNYMQNVEFDRDRFKAIISDVLAGGMDTSTNVLNWAFAELLRHPKVMEQVQKELQDVVGMDRSVEETDLPKLNYLNMVVKEVMRLHPPSPLLFPHESIEDIIINNFYIQKKSQIFINAWAIGRDPNAWHENAEEFNPDRFNNVNIDVHGHDFQLIPFGSGRRGCPALKLGLTVIQVVLAQLLHCFNWELPNGMSPCDIDMTEKFTVTLKRASPLLAIPTYRLNVKNF